MKNVALDEMNAGEVPGVLARRFNRLAQVQSNNGGSVRRGVHERAAKSTAAVQPDLAREELRLHGSNRLAKHFLPVRKHLFEFSPLVAVTPDGALLRSPPVARIAVRASRARAKRRRLCRIPFKEPTVIGEGLRRERVRQETRNAVDDWKRPPAAFALELPVFNFLRSGRG